MDHIKLPQEINRLDIKVPVLAQYEYDGEDFTSYPARQGYVCRGTGLDTTVYWDWSLEDNERHLAFVQAWLYFGLLREVLGPKYRQDRFVSRSEYRVHTGELRNRGATTQDEHG